MTSATFFVVTILLLDESKVVSSLLVVRSGTSGLNFVIIQIFGGEVLLEFKGDAKMSNVQRGQDQEKV